MKKGFTFIELIVAIAIISSVVLNGILKAKQVKTIQKDMSR
ncbi:MAG: prepilin-type N-terminal cleavage/methylation domain-containing protein [Patescibacteria group bacterium]